MQDSKDANHLFKILTSLDINFIYIIVKVLLRSEWELILMYT
jgi:hypothetical protein